MDPVGIVRYSVIMTQQILTRYNRWSLIGQIGWRCGYIVLKCFLDKFALNVGQRTKVLYITGSRTRQILRLSDVTLDVKYPDDIWSVRAFRGTHGFLPPPPDVSYPWEDIFSDSTGAQAESGEGSGDVLNAPISTVRWPGLDLKPTWAKRQAVSGPSSQWSEWSVAQVVSPGLIRLCWPWPRDLISRCPNERTCNWIWSAHPLSGQTQRATKVPPPIPTWMDQNRRAARFKLSFKLQYHGPNRHYCFNSAYPGACPRLRIVWI